MLYSAYDKYTDIQVVNTATQVQAETFTRALVRYQSQLVNTVGAVQGIKGHISILQYTLPTVCSFNTGSAFKMHKIHQKMCHTCKTCLSHIKHVTYAKNMSHM